MATEADTIMPGTMNNFSAGEGFFKALVQHASDIYCLTTTSFQIRFVNDTITGMLGYYPDELTSHSILEIIHPEDRATFQEWAALIPAGESGPSIEVRVKHAVGTLGYMQVFGTAVSTMNEESSILFNMRDIQAKKLADDALQQAEQRITMLLNNTKESFIILNSRLRVLAYNKAAQENSPFFFKQELQSGLSFFDLVDGSQVGLYSTIMQKVVEQGEQQYITFHSGKDGVQHIYEHTYRPFDFGAEGFGVFITSADVTEKYLAEKSLRESEEKFKTIIEYSFDAILILETDATITYASPSISHLLGFRPDELVGKNGFDFIHPDDIPQVREKFESIVNNVDETYADYRSITQEGSYIWIEAKGKNMCGNYLINGVLVSLRDITQWKKMVEEQTALTNELIKYNKDLQQFSFITSHNLRAPVANLISLLGLYNREKPGDVFNAELINKFEECTNQLNDTLNDLISVLVIRSKQNADLEYIRFRDVMNAALRNVKSLLQEVGGELNTSFVVDGIEYNKVHLESIILNLLSNAIKYASPDRKLQIFVSTEPTPEGVRLVFRDNGIGIDLDRYGDRLFGLYQRFHAGKQGKGLGLYMIKSQIIASGGSIKVDSTPGKGTTFFVHFKNKPVISSQAG